MHVKQQGPFAPGRRPDPRPGPIRLAPRRDIQGLRAVAVTLVVLDHAGVPFLGGGFIGVDVFFVVSGFLITQILVREAAVSGSLKLWRFYSRRAARILPASTLVLLVTSAVAVLTLSASRTREVLDDVLWSSALAANVHFANLDADYFAMDRALSPVQHYWSLAVEEQFYLVLPLLMLLVVTLGRRRLSSGKRFPGLWVTGIVVGLLTAASLAWSVVDTAASPSTAYFSTATRGWELGAGVLLALTVPRLTDLGRRSRIVLSALGLSAILAAAVTYGSGTPFPGWQAVVPVVGTMAVLAAGVGQDGQGLAKALTWRPCTWVGDLSYSIYLWHWPALVLGAPLLDGEDPAWLEKSVLIGVVVLLSTVSYHLVEQPFRTGRIPGMRGPLAIALWPVSIGAVVLSIVGVNHYETQQLARRAVEAQRYYDVTGAAQRAESSALSIPSLVAESVALADDRAPIHFPLANLDGLWDDHWARAYPCYATFTDTTAPACELGDPDAETTVVAVGDSHVGMWLPALDLIGRADGFKLVPFVKWACPSFDLPTGSGRKSGPTSCDQFRAWSLEQIQALRPDIILIGGRALPPNLDADPDELVDVWDAGVRSTVDTMSQITKDVRIIGDVPGTDTDPADCLSQEGSTMSTCTVEATPRSVLGIVATRRVAEEAGVPYVNVAPLTCFEKRCPLVVDQTVVYRDDNHISMTWSRRLVEELRERMALPLTPG